MMRVTQTGWLFLGVALLLYLASLTSQSSPLLFLIGIIAGCYVVNLFKARRALRHLELSAPANAQAVENQRLSEAWTVINHGKQPVRQLLITVAGETALRLRSIGGSSTAHSQPTLTFSRRGVYSMSDIRLTTSFPFGLIEAKRNHPLSGELIVHPAIYPAVCPPTSGFDVMVGGKYQGRRRTSSGSQFAGVRPFVTGDSLRNIHWKSSSKGLGLMVKTYEEELSGRVAVILDAGQDGDVTQLDNAVRAAGSLLFAALDAGHHAEFIDLARCEPQLYPPFTDGTEILHHLARLEMQTGCLSAANLRSAVARISRRAALALVLTAWVPGLRTVIEEWRSEHRLITLYLPESISISTELTGLVWHTYGPHAIHDPA